MYFVYREVRSLWRPEYAEYMVEGTPGQPYGSLVQHFNIVEHNMSFRRSEVQSLLQPDEVVLSLTCFPRWVLITYSASCTRNIQYTFSYFASKVVSRNFFGKTFWLLKCKCSNWVRVRGLIMMHVYCCCLLTCNGTAEHIPHTMT